MARRGRKRSAKPRYPSGRLRPETVDNNPPPEQVVRKARLAGDVMKIHLADCPLNILRARGLISEEQQAAARHYDTLYRSQFGDPRPTSVRIGDDGGAGVADPEKDEQRKRAYLRVVKDLTTGERLEVTNLAVYDMWPLILQSLEALDQLDMIRRALDKLIEARP